MSLDFSLEDVRVVEVYSRNITHNLCKMAKEAGLYQCLWRPEEGGFEFARDIIPILREGLAKLEDNPGYYIQFNPENGWGSYESLVEFVRETLKECVENPNARIQVSR
jgi:hypothetical protein